MTAVITVVIAYFKFTQGAWVIVMFVPIMVVVLVRLAKQYEREDHALDHEVPQAVAAPVRRRLVVMVFVDRLDLAVARAMQFGRTLRPDELRAVHFVIDQHAGRRARRAVARRTASPTWASSSSTAPTAGSPGRR